jgi:hypothetical protein
MKSKKVFFVVLVALAVFGFATISHAACNMSGKVVMAYSAGGSVVFYVAPLANPLPTRYVTFMTNNTYFTQLLAGAQNSHFTVYVSGTGTCTSTTAVSQNGGTVQYMYRYSNY